MLHRLFYFVVQLLILLVPPAWASSHFSVNHYVTDPYEEYFFYIGGVSGIFGLGIPSSLASLIISETLATKLAIGVYICFASAVYNYVFSPKWARFFVVSTANALLAGWSIIFGNIFMFLAMQ